MTAGLVMTEERARTILEAYGASPSRWPEIERDALLAFLADQPELLANAQAEAAALDALLGQGQAQPSDLLERRILRSLSAGRAAGNHARSGWAWRAPAAAAAAVLLAVSVSVGGGLFPGTSNEPDLEEIYADALDSYGADWSDWYGPDNGDS